MWGLNSPLFEDRVGGHELKNAGASIGKGKEMYSAPEPGERLSNIQFCRPVLHKNHKNKLFKMHHVAVGPEAQFFNSYFRSKLYSPYVKEDT